MTLLFSAERKAGWCLLEERYFVHQGKTHIQTIGLAIDTAEKEKVKQIGAEISSDFAPNDYRLNGLFHEIKSSDGKYISLSNNEYRFAIQEIDAGRDIIYDIFQQHGYHEYEFLGYNSFAHMLERKLVRRSKYANPQKQEDGSWENEQGWYWTLEDAKANFL